MYILRKPISANEKFINKKKNEIIKLKTKLLSKKLNY